MAERLDEIPADKDGNLKQRVIDGQQRINACREFFAGKFTVYGKYAKDFKYWDLRTILEYRARCFVGKNIYLQNEIKVYLQRNCGGTMHTKEEILKAQQYL